jgi:hypothetical protein
VDSVRDLGRVEPWRESLERSLARRGKLTRSSFELSQLRPQPAPARDEYAHESTTHWPLRRRPIATRLMTLVVSAGGILAVALLVATLASVFGHVGASGRSQQVAFSADARAGLSRTAAGRTHAGSGHAGAGPGGAGLLAGLKRTATCKPVVRSIGYVNPLAGAHVTPERIDQGVDYAGSGTLTAIGAASVTHVAMSDTGWPGAFIEYRLLGGPDGGCYVYYGEGVRPTPGLRVGETVRAGQAIATIIPGYSSGIEIGWGAGIGTETYAAKMGEWSAPDDANSVPSAAGKSFSALIAALGGPRGKTEG